MGEMIVQEMQNVSMFLEVLNADARMDTLETGENALV